MEMLEKKDPGKFTVRFNIADPQQRQVIELLNQQGRYKAQFLTSAILHYVRCSETPDIRGVPSVQSVQSEEIERIVRNVLAQQRAASSQDPPREETAAPWEKPLGSPPDDGSPAEDAEREAIFKTLDAFRQK